MRADSVIRWFMPKEEGFRELLSRDSQNLVKGARLFAEIARATSFDDRRVKAVQLKAIEHDGDQVTRQIFEALNSSFITPLDREDIRSLASTLDDILDHLEGVAHYLVLFELKESSEALRQFSDILVVMAEAVDKATLLVWDLGNAALQHRDRRPLQARWTQPHRGPEVEGDLRRSRRGLRWLQGLQPRPRQRRNQERLSRP